MPGPDTLAIAGRAEDPLAGGAALIDRVSRGHVCWWVLFAAVNLVLILPLFLVSIPPLTDYPNHLAREFILAFGAHDPVLSRMYAQRWGIIPNLAIDLVMPAMARVMPLYVAGKIMLAVTLLLPVAGMAAYHRAAFHRRSFWPLAGGIVAYNGLFFLGFLNFQISLGMALLGAAAWVAWRDRRPLLLTVLGAAWCCAIFFAHVFGLLFLAVIVGGYELDRLLRLHRERRPVVPDVARTAPRLTVIFLPALVLCLLAPIAGRGAIMLWRPWPDRLAMLLLPFLSYDVASGIFLGVVVLGLIGALAAQRAYALAPGARWTMPVLLIGYLCCPSMMNSTGFVSDRLPIMLGFLLFAAGRPQRLSMAARSGTMLALGALFAIRMAAIGSVWYDHNSDLVAMSQVIAPVPPGSRVLLVSVTAKDGPAYWESMRPGRWVPWLFRTDIHLPALLVIERRAFWPLLFATPGKQPVVLRQPYAQLAGPAAGMPPDYHVLQHPLTAAELRAAPYLAHWQSDFDYVLLLDAGGAGNLTQYLPNRLRLLQDRNVAALFRVVKPVASPH